MNKSFHFIFMLVVPIMFGMIAIASKFVPIFFGDGYSKVIVLIHIMSVILIAIGLSNVIGTQYLLPTKQQKSYTISVVTGALVNFVINFILIRYYQSIGAAIATVIAEISVAGVQLFLVRKQISVFKVLKIFLKYFISGFIMFICIFALGKFTEISILAIICQVLVGFGIYIFMLLILKDEFIFFALKNIKTIVKK